MQRLGPPVFEQSDAYSIVCQRSLDFSRSCLAGRWRALPAERDGQMNLVLVSFEQQILRVCESYQMVKTEFDRLLPYAF